MDTIYQKPKYIYRAVVVRVYDGDSIRVNIDLGFGVWLKDQAVRLLGIDTPEVRGSEREEGIKVRDFVRGEIEDEKVILKSYRDKKGKYGRWLGEIFYERQLDEKEVKQDSNFVLTNLNVLLLETGRATEYKK